MYAYTKYFNHPLFSSSLAYHKKNTYLCVIHLSKK